MGKNRFNNGQEVSQRQLRVAELIRRTIAEILIRDEIHDPELSKISITVGEVKTSTDLKIATVNVYPLAGAETPNIVQLLTRNKFEIKRALSKRISLKFTPELKFKLDTTFDQMERTLNILEENKTGGTEY